MKTIHAIIILVLIIVLGIVYKLNQIKKRTEALKNSTIVIATIKDIGGGRGTFNVKVEYNYNGKNLESEINTYNLDSLKRNVRVNLLISKQYPEEYIKYIGVAK